MNKKQDEKLKKFAKELRELLDKYKLELKISVIDLEAGNLDNCELKV